jgi:hemoglobin-like flavoprotein
MVHAARAVPNAGAVFLGNVAFARQNDWHALCDAVPMTPEQIELVQRTWRAVLPVGDTAAELFYGKLFSLDPGIRAMVLNDLVDQGRNLTAMISVAVGALAKPERILLAVRQLGQRHAAYGVEPRHYQLVAVSLLFMLEKVLGEEFTPEAERAWTSVYDFLAETMQEAADLLGA